MSNSMRKLHRSWKMLHFLLNIVNALNENYIIFIKLSDQPNEQIHKKLSFSYSL